MLEVKQVAQKAEVSDVWGEVQREFLAAFLDRNYNSFEFAGSLVDDKMLAEETYDFFTK